MSRVVESGKEYALEPEILVVSIVVPVIPDETGSFMNPPTLKRQGQHYLYFKCLLRRAVS